MPRFLEAESLVFIHIPKTAGTSFASYLHGKLLSYEQGYRGRKRTLHSGHNYFYLTYPTVANGYFMTFLREPISRTISQYRSLRNPKNYPANWRDQWNKQQVAALEFCQRASFSEFVHSCDPNVLSHIVNPQTRMLAGSKIEIDVLLKNHSTQEAALESASQNLLRKIDFVGIYEQMTDSLRLFQKETGLSGDLPHLNQSLPFDANLSSKEVVTIRNLTSLDSRLYQFGKLLFQARLRAVIEA